MLPESCAHLCFGGRKRNRLFIAGSLSLYTVSVETQGAHITREDDATIWTTSSPRPEPTNSHALRSRTTQDKKPHKRREHRPAEHAELHLVLEMVRGQGEPADEQAHGEPDTAQHRDTV